MALNEKARQEIIEIVNSLKDEPTPLMMVLEEVQTRFGYIPMEVQELISDMLNIPVSEIYGVVTFYSFFSLNPKGKYVIGVCLGTACYVKGSKTIIDKFSQLLNIKPGETSSDGLFTLDALRCIGCCALAPAVRINDTVYPNMSLNDVEKIVIKYRGMGA